MHTFLSKPETQAAVNYVDIAAAGLKTVCHGNMKYLFLLFFLIGTNAAFGQKEWKFMTEREGIKVFSKEVADSKIKALRVTCEVNGSIPQIVALLMDVDAATDWVSHTKSCTLIRQSSPSELYYYSEVDLPWPLENRDFVAKVSVSQHPVTKVVTINAPAISGHVPEKKGIVRIRHSVGFWVLTAVNPHTTRVEYTLQVDPGGIIPAWLVNSLSAQGPIESFQNMKKQVSLPRYRHAKFPFLDV